MVNGDWDRLWFTLIGFRSEFGRWPTRMELPPSYFDPLTSYLSCEDRVKVEMKLQLVRGSSLVAEDESGARYEYRLPPWMVDDTRRPEGYWDALWQRAREWLGVKLED